MSHQITQSYFLTPIFVNYDFTLVPLTLQPINYIENMALQVQQPPEEQNALLQRNSVGSQETEQIQAENLQLRENISDQESKPKRKYRPRRSWLEKKYRCNAKGCRGKYSSKIALNSHKRKKHPKKVAQWFISSYLSIFFHSNGPNYFITNLNSIWVDEQNLSINYFSFKDFSHCHHIVLTEDDFTFIIFSLIWILITFDLLKMCHFFGKLEMTIKPLCSLQLIMKGSALLM